MKKYKGCYSPFMFDNFNLVIYKPSGKDHIEIREHPYGMLYRINKDVWIGMRACNDIKEIYPDSETMISGECVNGDYFMGEFIIPVNLLSYKEADNLIKCLSTEKGYSHFQKCNRVISSVLCTIMMMGKERRRIQRKTDKTSKKSKTQKVNENHNKVFLLDDIINYISDNYIPSANHHTIQCPCWEVRGHYRHYKTGKIVFIPSYKKGKDKDKAEPKPHEYYL